MRRLPVALVILAADRLISIAADVERVACIAMLFGVGDLGLVVVVRGRIVVERTASLFTLVRVARLIPSSETRGRLGSLVGLGEWRPLLRRLCGPLDGCGPGGSGLRAGGRGALLNGRTRGGRWAELPTA